MLSHEILIVFFGPVFSRLVPGNTNMIRCCCASPDVYVFEWVPGYPRNSVNSIAHVTPSAFTIESFIVLSSLNLTAGMIYIEMIALKRLQLSPYQNIFGKFGTISIVSSGLFHFHSYLVFETQVLHSV